MECSLFKFLSKSRGRGESGGGQRGRGRGRGGGGAGNKQGCVGWRHRSAPPAAGSNAWRYEESEEAHTAFERRVQQGEDIQRLLQEQSGAAFGRLPASPTPSTSDGELDVCGLAATLSAAPMGACACCVVRGPAAVPTIATMRTTAHTVVDARRGIWPTRDVKFQTSKAT